MGQILIKPGMIALETFVHKTVHQVFDIPSPALQNRASNLVKSQSEDKMPTWQNLFSPWIKMGLFLLQSNIIALKTFVHRTFEKAFDMLF